MRLEKKRLETLDQIGDICSIFLGIVDYDPEILIFKKSNKEDTFKALNLVNDELVKYKKWKQDKLLKVLTSLVKDNNLKNGDLFWPLRVSLSGQEKSPPPEEIMEIIGKEESLNRINKALAKLKWIN